MGNHLVYIIREEGSIFAPQRIPFCMALGVAACTVGKVRVSTVFMCVFVARFDRRIFLLFVKNGFVVGVRCQGNSESLKECEYPHCASATRRLALDNRTYPAQLANSTHTRCRPTLSWMGGGRGGRVVRAEGGRGGREGGRGGREGGRGGREGGREGGRDGGREGAPVKEGRVKGRVDEGNERGKDRTRHGRREGKRGGRK